MNQTIALFLDSYRELNSRKLFWITIGITALVVLTFLGLGLNDTGISIFGFQKNLRFNASAVDRSVFYRVVFFELGVNYWLTWIATILALVSTAGIFPDLLTGGSIDMYLSKPISRLRLFLTKYFAALLFVAVQVAVFTVGSFAVLRIRGGFWFPGVFIAIPLVLAFYSYLYCICVLLGVLTRSPIAALLLTIFFWFSVLGIHVYEVGELKDMMKGQIVAERLDRQIPRQQAEVRSAAKSPTLPDAEARLDELQSQQRANDSALQQDLKLHQKFYVAVTMLPKTSETVALMSRWLIKASESTGPRSKFEESSDEEDAPQPLFFGITTDDVRAQVMVDKALRDRSVNWVIGTSLLFEAVILGFAAWIFCRRDY
jgi:ABC-type transport system involved in multi-copper enzyme maturation permease subunit